MYKIEYADGKVRWCATDDFTVACKYANAFGGLVKKVLKAEPTAPEQAPVQVQPPREDEVKEKADDRMLRVPRLVKQLTNRKR